MKHLKKVKRSDLKSIKGGSPFGPCSSISICGFPGCACECDLNCDSRKCGTIERSGVCA